MSLFFSENYSPIVSFNNDTFFVNYFKRFDIVEGSVVDEEVSVDNSVSVDDLYHEVAIYAEDSRFDRRFVALYETGYCLNHHEDDDYSKDLNELSILLAEYYNLYSVLTHY